MEYVEPFVSVVIPTYNRSTTISLCLDSLFNQTYPAERYEVIIINDGSKDNTEEILKKIEPRAPCGFKWSTQKNQGIATATNSAIFRSKGDIICFTGDDCIAEKDWISNLVHGFIDDDIGAVGGKVINGEAKTQIQQFIENSRVLDQETFFKRNTLITGSAAYRRHILKQVGGLDNHLNACIDLDLSIKTQLLGYKLHYNPEAVVHHDHPATVRGLFSQQYRNGIGYVRLHRKYGQKYNAGYYTAIYGGRIMGVLVRYPVTLLTALVSKKGRSYVLNPLYEILYYFSFSSGVARETILGKEFREYPVRPRIESMGFMEDKSMVSLWQKIVEKIHKIR
jgi:cellulose synthase/poly-beta-1,6-N-acetylglucosamine synthase-like glycosyltransferase